MSQFSKKEIQEIKKLFQEELNLTVSDEEACRHAEQFINLLVSTYRDAPGLASNSPP
jgi:hypothetical protein